LRIFCAPGLAQVSPILTGQKLCNNWCYWYGLGVCLGSANRMRRLWWNRVMSFFQHLAGHKIANQVSLTGYSEKGYLPAKQISIITSLWNLDSLVKKYILAASRLSCGQLAACCFDSTLGNRMARSQLPTKFGGLLSNGA